MIKVFLISFFLVLINTIGQICLKQAILVKTKRIIYLILGYFLFVMAIIVSFYLMKIIELKYFTVIMSLIYLTVLLSSTYIFKESLDKNKIIGTIVVMVGIIIFIGG